MDGEHILLFFEIEVTHIYWLTSANIYIYILVDIPKYRQNKTRRLGQKKKEKRRANGQKNMTNPFKLFFVPVLLLFSKFYEQLLLPRPSPSAEAVDSEVVAPLAAGDDDAVNQAEAPIQAAGDGAEKQAQAAGFVVVDDMEWLEIVIAFCLASAIDIALLSVQGHSPPAPFHLFSISSNLTRLCFHCR